MKLKLHFERVPLSVSDAVNDDDDVDVDGDDDAIAIHYCHLPINIPPVKWRLYCHHGDINKLLVQKWKKLFLCT